MRLFPPFAALTLAAALLTGCGTDDGVVDNLNTEGRSGVAPTGYRKPGAPVSLKYAVPSRATPGTTVDVSLTLRTDGNVDDLQVALSGGDDVELLCPATHELGASKRWAVHTLDCQVVVWKGGTRFVNVFARTRQGGQEMARSFAVPIEVLGEPARVKSEGVLERSDDGENVRSLPAKERREDGD